MSAFTLFYELQFSYQIIGQKHNMSIEMSFVLNALLIVLTALIPVLRKKLT